MNVTEELFKLKDSEYQKFQSALIPTINPDTMIGVRTPHLKKLAKAVRNDAEKFMASQPHTYYEENNLHGFVISLITDYDDCIEALDRFLPYVDNWATCDGIRPVCFKKNKNRLICDIKRWIASDKVYTVRFGIEMLMTHFLDDDFDAGYLRMVASVRSDEYYINMMIAWYFATALAKQWDEAVVYIEKRILPAWVHNKTIQKAIESYRISEERKKYLKKYKF